MNLVIYRSFLGSSEKYAKWLAESIGADIKKYSQVKESDLEAADKIALVGATYAGWLSLNGFINKHLKTLVSKKTVFVNVGLAPADDPWNLKSWEKLPQEFRDKAKLFKIMGKMKKEEEGNIKRENLDEVIKYLKK